MYLMQPADDGGEMAGVGGDDDDDECGGGCDEGAFDMEEQMRMEIGHEEMPEGGAVRARGDSVYNVRNVSGVTYCM